MKPFPLFFLLSVVITVTTAYTRVNPKNQLFIRHKLSFSPSISTSDSFPIESMVKSIRNSLIASLVSLSIVGYGNINVAHAGIFDSSAQNMVYEIGSYQRPVNDLLEQLRPTEVANPIGVYVTTQILKGGKEDADVVLNYQETYFKPLQHKMEEAANTLVLSNSQDQEKLKTLPLLMKGHILELNQAIAEQKAPAQAKEVEEIQETLAQFLKLASSAYKIEPYSPARPLTEKEIFGPLGCEFWGRKRLAGSNTCVDP